MIFIKEMGFNFLTIFFSIVTLLLVLRFSYFIESRVLSLTLPKTRFSLSSTSNLSFLNIISRGFKYSNKLLPLLFLSFPLAFVMKSFFVQHSLRNQQILITGPLVFLLTRIGYIFYKFNQSQNENLRLQSKSFFKDNLVEISIAVLILSHNFYIHSEIKAEFAEIYSFIYSATGFIAIYMMVLFEFSNQMKENFKENFLDLILDRVDLINLLLIMIWIYLPTDFFPDLPYYSEILIKIFIFIAYVVLFFILLSLHRFLTPLVGHKYKLTKFAPVIFSLFNLFLVVILIFSEM